MHVPLAARFESKRQPSVSGLGFNAAIKGSRPSSAPRDSPVKATYTFPDGVSAAWRARAKKWRERERERKRRNMCVCVRVLCRPRPFFTTCCSLPDLTLLPFLSENVGLGYSGAVERADSVCDFPDMRDLRKGGSPNKKQLTPTIMEIPIKAPQISVQQCR